MTNSARPGHATDAKPMSATTRVFFFASDDRIQGPIEKLPGTWREER